IRVIGNTSEPVALLMEKDHILVASILGALKSRKFYVALDASYPVARNRQILEDSESSLLLTSASYCGVARELAGANVRVLPLNPIDLSEGAGDPELDIPADDLACVLYTSGSTGAPKGVMQTHRNLMTQVMNVTNSQHISPGDRFSLLHSPSFAAATHNLFGSLLNGASVFPFEVQKEGLVMLKEWLLAERITVYHSAPSLFRSFGRSLAGGIPFTDLRLIVLGGEMVLNRDVDLYKTLFPDSCLLRINLGISEANVFTEFFVDIATELRPGPIPVGYAVPGVEVAVIDESGGRAEAYGVGEITVKSAHLSPGYWRQPDLTATAFSGDPYGSGERVYRTGDIGYLTEDGCLVCLGRQDSLVKIRGFRVETAEVEFALLTLKGLKEAAVNTGKDRQGKTRLVAHVALEDGFALSGADLRASLRQMLPDFMVPSGFVLHAELPRNARGKIDRQQLIEETNLELATAASGRGNKVYAGPGLAARNESVHSRLIEIWERILGLQGIGAEQDFFELGGDSLAAASMAAEIEGVFGIRFLPSMLLELPTIRQIGLRIVEADSGTGSLVPITVTGSNAPFFCAHDI
ncbi:MAG: non-ribosomal peptide synthetase, partial [Blastocatellia bacterium]